MASNNVTVEKNTSDVSNKKGMNGKSGAKAKKKGHTGLIVFFAFLLTIALLGACYVLNVGQVKDIVSNMFVNKQTEAQSQVNEDNQKLLKTQQTKLDKKEAELNAKATELDTKEKSLQELQTQLNALKDELNGQKKEYKSIAKIYETMDSESAANILMQYTDKNQVAQIIMQLSNTKSAEILAAMTPSFASQLLKMTN